MKKWSAWRTLKFVWLGALVLGTVVFVGCPPSYVVYRTPRMIVDTIQTGRCVGKQWTFPCRFPHGHLKKRVVRCMGRWRMRVVRRKWVVPDSRCRHHEFMGEPAPQPKEIIP